MKKAKLDNKNVEYINKLVEYYYNDITAECIEYYGKCEEAYAMRDKIIEELNKKKAR